MSVINGKETDTNASPSAYGWVFQVGAGITLMLENIKELTSLKMEGASDDIELTLQNGKIYAQAKSVTKIGDQRSASTNLKKSLELLSSDNKNGDAIKLVYVTNISNPLSSSFSSAFCYEHTYDYSTLPDDAKQNIERYVGADFPTDKFQVHILNFFGDGDNKFESVKEKIAGFLREAIDDPSYNKRLLDSWFETFMVNCADKPDKEKKLCLTKRQIMYPVIVLVIDPPIGETEFTKVCDYENYNEIEQEYRNSINRSCCDYELIINITGNYLIRRESSIDKRNYKYDFVKSEWRKYESRFMMIKNDEKREALVKIILLTIINQRTKLDGIREAAKL